VTLEKGDKEEQPVIFGECHRCGQCCICWYYDQPDQPAGEPPRKGWCPHLDLKTKVCLIWESRPEGCRKFPTPRDFELGAVPKGCGFWLANGGNKDG